MGCRPGALEDLGLIMFWAGKKVLVTGANGFVGTWLSAALVQQGADVSGFGFSNDFELGKQARLSEWINFRRGDVRDADKLAGFVQMQAPDVVFHLAAQPLVDIAHKDPIGTFTTNVNGTINLLTASAANDVTATVVITSDKVYFPGTNAHKETDPLGGLDPYSASKSAADVVTRDFLRSVMAPRGLGVATARAGNILGGGDHHQSRLVPTLIAKLCKGQQPIVRNPSYTRPWQSIIDVIDGYLRLGKRLFSEPGKYSRAYNFGPADYSSTVSDVVNVVLKYAPSGGVIKIEDSDMQESAYLAVDSERARQELAWSDTKSLDEIAQHLWEWITRQEQEEINAILFDIVNNELIFDS